MADPTWAFGYFKILFFNRNYGRHLSYGEIEQLLSVVKELDAWALGQAELAKGYNRCFRCVATSESEQISFLSVTSIQRDWDGRWVNTLIIWSITTWLLCKYRYEIIGIPRQKTKPPSKSQVANTVCSFLNTVKTLNRYKINQLFLVLKITLSTLNSEL